ncbi:MAG: efflux RND transporter periplasmic adaptor subunit [Alphaproteobacteria bacterium]|nr:efflux RND transporter periplasmic adaptor subunit [Alphaproteobacteria bacterium]
MRLTTFAGRMPAAVAILAAFLAGGGAWAQGRPGGGGPGGAGGGPLVAADPVKLEIFRQTVPVLGRLVARRAGSVAARVAGAVADLKVDVGDRVAAGDVIAVINADKLKAARDDAAGLAEQRKAQFSTGNATLAKVKGELQRIDALRQSTAFNKAKYDDMAADVSIAESRLLEMRAQVRQAEVQVVQAEQDLINTVVKAPYDGIVTARNTEIGAYVQTGAAVVALLNDREIEIEAEVPTDRLTGLAPGDTIDVELDDKTAHTAKVRAIVPQENPTTRTRTVRFTPSFGKTTKALAANQSVKVLIPAGAAEKVLTIQKDAVLLRAGSTVVYVLKDGKAEERQVVLGAAVRDRLVVKSGLNAEELVIVRGNEQLRPGQTVRVAAQG